MLSNTYRAAIARAMHSALSENDNTVILGQGVSDYKGLFGTTLGLAEKFPNRVIETPIAEDSVAGICIGASLNGLYPINTHIRADFGLLVFNQLINLAAKYRYMFGGIFEVPLMMRMVIGRSWGQGAQHSQSLQSLLAHIPGLVVVMPSRPEVIEASYRFAIERHRGPVVMLEHRLMYEIEFKERDDSGRNITIFGSHVDLVGTDLTVVATSIMVLEMTRAAQYLSDYGISVELIDLHSISHPDHELIMKSVAKTGRLIVADTSWAAYGVAAEINRIINEHDPKVLKAPVRTLNMSPSPCPTAKALEDLYYPDLRDCIDSICVAATGLEKHGIPLPPKKSMTDDYKHFRGPF